MNYYGSYITRLIEELSSLPGIGTKSAQRLAFYIINMPEEKAKALSESIIKAKENIKIKKLPRSFWHGTILVRQNRRGVFLS